MRALLTGGTGFVGASILRELLQQGWDVRCLVRPGSPRDNLQGLEVETAEGDLRDFDSLVSALKGCQVLFHCAAQYALWVPRPEEIYENNVTGTANILRAAREVGIEKVVHTSTVATIGPPGRGDVAREEDLIRAEDAIGHYKKSKILAEDEARKANAGGLPVVIVNPSAPIGPLDIKPTPTGQLLVDFVSGKMPGYTDTGLNLVDVRDVAKGHLLALEKGREGERYILGGANLHLKDLTRTLAAIAGVKAPKIRLPYFVALAYGVMCEVLVGRILRGTPQVTIDGVRLTRTPMYYDSSKAIRELGFPQSPVEGALRDGVDWFREHGFLRDPS